MYRVISSVFTTLRRCVLVGGVCATWLGLALPAAALEVPACQQGGAAQASPALAQRLAAMALHEHEQMGGALIDETGGLVRAGFAEAERDRLPDSAMPTWQRVWGYWESAGLGTPVDPDGPTAVMRMALVDTPWSAAFISHLMRQAGLDDTQFTFAATHQSYVRAALASNSAEAQNTPTPYAYRACDVLTTAPRVGYLLCHVRAPDEAMDTFARLALLLLWRVPAMHCELVVRGDSQRIEVVGGNVVQTVVLRRLSLQADGSGRLWPAYLASAHARQVALAAVPPPEGAAQSLLPDTHLSLQPWNVLLQLRQGVLPSTARP